MTEPDDDDCTDCEDCEDCEAESQAYFCGDECTCEHDDDQHDWMGCGVDDCKCEASWEE